MSSTGFGNWNKGARVGDASDYIRNMRIMAQNAADRTYQSDPKRNFARTSDAVLTSQMAQSAANALANLSGSNPTTPPQPEVSGGGGGRNANIGVPVVNSAYFAGTSNSYLTIPHDSDLNMEGADFTIEWFQRWVGSGGSFARPFSKGSFPDNAEIAVSYESGRTYVWANGDIVLQTDDTPRPNEWVHVAIVRQANQLRLYIGGDLYASVNLPGGTTIAGTTNFDLGTGTNVTTYANLTIGNETIPTANAAFQGYITNFRWTKGTALYSGGAFIVPTSQLTPHANTKLLIKGITDIGGLNKTVTSTGVSGNASTPF
jgi:hypothetical protein